MSRRHNWKLVVVAVLLLPLFFHPTSSNSSDINSILDFDKPVAVEVTATLNSDANDILLAQQRAFLPIVAIDVGHTISRGGATSARGVPEFQFNLQMAKLISQRLNATRKAVSRIINSDGKIRGLKERVTYAQEIKASVFVSIHHDSVQKKYLSKWVHQGKEKRYSDNFEGYSVFYSERNGDPKRSLQLAEKIAASLHADNFVFTRHHAEKIKGENRPLINADTGVYQFDGLYVLRKNVIPSVLVECGIILNRQEEERLRNPKYQLDFANSVVNGILDFLYSS